ncbi:TIM-barrel domain-containing protein [Evansella tamaricis]|uniref:Glycoside hydrolase family 31 protein n=1 Tax=Evansella tamaricis TaxID=2069301 RepID=A0ABS6JJN6_9BACI|nr:TIM-barrel domain-containing protein [Evansella tamaricis]MBU9713877.1 glycoside hydrolase family 31 protein [Evansella tamaricis]
MKSELYMNTAKFFMIRLDQLKGNWDRSVEELNRFPKELPIYHSALWLWLAAEQVENTGDLADQSLSLRSVKLGEDIRKNWRTLKPSVFSEDEKIWMSNLGFVYGALMNGKRIFSTDDWQKTLIEIRDFVFNHGLKGGMLVSHENSKVPSMDLLGTVMPFGLFSPEDLVVVEAVQYMETYLVSEDMVRKSIDENTHSPASAAWLAWYFCEKGDMERAKKYLKMAKKTGNEQERLVADAISKLVMHYLSEKNSSTIIIHHKPLGNENVYEQLPYERTPRNPLIGERVKVRANVWPLETNDNVFIKKWCNGIETDIECQLEREKSIWEGDLGEVIEEDVAYQFYVKNHTAIKAKSKVFYFKPRMETYVKIIHGVKRERDRLLILVEEAFEGKQFIISIHADSKQVKLDVKLTHEEQKDFIPLEKASRFDLNQFDVSLTEKPSLSITSKDKSWSLQSSLTIPFLEWEMDKETMIYSVKWNFLSPLEERFYALGERYKTLEYRGERLDCYVYNQYRDQGNKTYMPVPFFLSTMGYGCYVPTSNYTMFDFASTLSTIWSVSEEVTGNGTTSLSKLVFYLGQIPDVCSSFMKETGPPALLPAWALGPWMSSNNWDRESIAREQVELTKKYQIPSTVIVLEQWSDEATYYIFNDAIYDVNSGKTAHQYEEFRFPAWGRWPNPKGMINDFHKEGLRVILWQIPIQKYLNKQQHKQKEMDEKHMIEQGFAVRHSDGTPYRIPEGWFKESLLMDFSNREGKQWWFEKRKYLLDIGVDGFKTDGGEFVFGNDVQFYDGRKGNEMRNEYPNDYVKAYYEFANEGKNGDALTFSRAGYTGAQQFPAHWAGDERSTFDAFKNSLIAGLSAGLSGIIFWGWDLAGFNGDIPSSELFIRSSAMAAFCPIMQYHAESKGEFNQDRTPWNIAERTGEEKAISGYRFYANVRMNLLPYLYHQALLSTREYKPMMRAMVYSFPKEPECHHLYDQYMFGEDLLVAPVIEEGATERFVYFPRGNWVSLWDDIVVTGPCRKRISADLTEIPVYVREGAMLLFNTDKSGKLGSWVGNRMTMAYPRLKLCPNGPDKQILMDHLSNETTVSVEVKNGEGIIEVDSHYFSITVNVNTALMSNKVKKWIINEKEVLVQEKNPIIEITI